MNVIARQKYIFDQGMVFTSQFIGIINTSLLIVAVSDKLKAHTGIGRTWFLVVPAVTAYLVGTWLLGYLLDRSRFLRHYQDECNQRNPAFADLGNAMRSTRLTT